MTNTTELPPITTRSEFRAALLWGVQTALARGARRMLWVDRDFSEWPLGGAALHAQLTDWLRLPQRRLTLLAASFDEVPRRHARFVTWRRDWAHAVEAFSAPAEAAAALPTLLVDDGPVSVQLMDSQHWRGRCSLDARSSRLLRDELDAVLQQSEAAFPANRLGL
jgi:hypothetical protein